MGEVYTSPINYTSNILFLVNTYSENSIKNMLVDAL